jgi:hypothetical protein
MKAVTAHRPWGYAIAFLDKRIENRIWPCPLPVGSYLAIHNGQKWDKDGDAFIQKLNASELIENPTPENDPAGAIIAIARFVGNVKEDKSPWFFGPYGWKLENVIAIEPVYCRGQQGLWNVPEALMPRIKANYQKSKFL